MGRKNIHRSIDSTAKEAGTLLFFTVVCFSLFLGFPSLINTFSLHGVETFDVPIPKKILAMTYYGNQFLSWEPVYYIEDEQNISPDQNILSLFIMNYGIIQYAYADDNDSEESRFWLLPTYNAPKQSDAKSTCAYNSSETITDFIGSAGDIHWLHGDSDLSFGCFYRTYTIGEDANSPLIPSGLENFFKRIGFMIDITDELDTDTNGSCRVIKQSSIGGNDPRLNITEAYRLATADGTTIAGRTISGLSDYIRCQLTNTQTSEIHFMDDVETETSDYHDSLALNDTFYSTSLFFGTSTSRFSSTIDIHMRNAYYKFELDTPSDKDIPVWLLQEHSKFDGELDSSNVEQLGSKLSFDTTTSNADKGQFVVFKTFNKTTDGIENLDFRVTGEFQAVSDTSNQWLRIELKDGRYGTANELSFPENKHSKYDFGGSLGVIHLEPSLTSKPFDISLTPNWSNSTQEYVTLFIGVDDNSTSGSIKANITSVEFDSNIKYDFTDINELIFYNSNCSSEAELISDIGEACDRDYDQGLVNVTNISTSGVAGVNLPTPSGTSSGNAIATGDNTIDLIWDHNLLNVTDFRIERETPTGGGFSVVADTNNVTRSYSDSGLLSGTEYNYKVCAQNGNSINTSTCTTMSATTTGSPPPPPSAPTSVNATAVEDDVRIDWTSVSASPSVTSYDIFRTVAGLSDNFESYETGELDLDATGYQYIFDGSGAGQSTARCINKATNNTEITGSYCQTNPTVIDITFTDRDNCGDTLVEGAGETCSTHTEPISGDQSLFFNYTLRRNSGTDATGASHFGRTELPTTIDEVKFKFTTDYAFGGGSEADRGGTGSLIIEYNFENGTTKSISWHIGRSAGASGSFGGGCGTGVGDFGDSSCNQNYVTAERGKFSIDPRYLPDFDAGSPAVATTEGTEMEKDSPNGEQFGIINEIPETTVLDDGDGFLNVTTRFLSQISPSVSEWEKVESWDIYIGGNAITSQNTGTATPPAYIGGEFRIDDIIFRSEGTVLQQVVNGTTFELIGSVGIGTLTFTDTTVDPDTYYTYRVRANNAVGAGDNGTSNLVLTNDIPAQVQNLEALSEVNKINLQWTLEDNGTGTPSEGVGFVDYKIFKENTTDGSDFFLLATVIDPTTIYNDTAVEPIKNYTYKVGAINAVGSGQNSTEVIASDATPPTTPFAVTDLGVTPIGDDCSLSWTAPFEGGAPITGYKIRRSVDDGTFVVHVANTGSSTPSYTDLNLVGGSTYSYDVRAINSFGEASGSNIATCIPEVSEVPSPPTGLTATNVGDDVELNWNAPASGSAPTGYKIERKVENQAFNVLVADTGSTATTFTDTTIPALGTEVTYRVSSINTFGESSPSNQATTTTANAPDMPTLMAQQVGDLIRLTWTEPTSDGTIVGYKIERRVNNGGFSVLVANTSSTSLTYDDSAVTKPNKYGYRVRALDDLPSEGKVSNIVDVVFGSHVKIQVREQDGSSFKGGGEVRVSNSTFSLTKSLNSLTNVVFDNLVGGASYNYTFIDLDDFILNKTINHSFPSGNNTEIFTINALVFDVDCPSNLGGTDVRIKSNYTDIHDITAYPATPVCDSSDKVSWSTQWTGNGTDQSVVVADFISPKFKANADQFLVSSVPTSTVYSSSLNRILSDEFNVTSITSVTINFDLFMGQAPPSGGTTAPTIGTTGSGSSSVSIPSQKVVFELRLTGLTLLSLTHGFIQPSDVIDGEITIGWDGERDMRVKRIEVGDDYTNILRFDQRTPFDLDPVVDGTGETARSEATIGYSIFIPPAFCDEELGITMNCLERELITIPVTVVFEFEGVEYTGGTEIVVDARETPVDIVQAQVIVFGLVGLFAVLFANQIRKRIGRTGKSNRKKARTRQRIGTRKK